MILTIYQIDAFAEHQFEGNPAAVVPLTQWLPDAIMQAIAAENNLSETAFFVPSGNDFHIRWFTPSKEIRLCGHATLATAFVLFRILGHKGNALSFESLSGLLTVSIKGELLTLDFPTQEPIKCDMPPLLSSALGKTSIECFKHVDYLVVFDKEEDVVTLSPDHEILKQLDLRGVIVTAPSSNYDFISRFFVPSAGIPEDPVTGSAHTQLIPYWSERLGRTTLQAKQVSKRGGKLFCELKGDRVLISGYAVKYLEGTIEIKL